MSEAEPLAGQPRYAIYLAPRPEDALWRFGSLVLGYDAAAGKEITGFRLPSMPQDLWKIATARPRTYGFHATLKAPFALKTGITEQDLIEGLAAFAAKTPAIEKLVLQLEVLDKSAAGGFLALVPQVFSKGLQRLEAATVVGLDQFRAPLTEDNLAKRNPAALTARQQNYLVNYGYPHVLEEFRPHFTLSDRMPNPEKLVSELGELLIGHVGTPAVTIDELVLFKQPDPMSRFQIIARTPLLGPSKLGPSNN